MKILNSFRRSTGIFRTFSWTLIHIHTNLEITSQCKPVHTSVTCPQCCPLLVRNVFHSLIWKFWRLLLVYEMWRCFLSLRLWNWPAEGVLDVAIELYLEKSLRSLNAILFDWGKCFSPYSLHHFVFMSSLWSGCLCRISDRQREACWERFKILLVCVYFRYQDLRMVYLNLFFLNVNLVSCWAALTLKWLDWCLVSAAWGVCDDLSVWWRSYWVCDIDVFENEIMPRLELSERFTGFRSP